jgi:hypothetical protein
LNHVAVGIGRRENAADVLLTAKKNEFFVEFVLSGNLDFLFDFCVVHDSVDSMKR